MRKLMMALAVVAILVMTLPVIALAQDDPCEGIPPGETLDQCRAETGGAGNDSQPLNVPQEVADSASADVAQYQYDGAADQYVAGDQYGEGELPPTGGGSLVALGAGVLLVVGGLLARKIVH